MQVQLGYIPLSVCVCMLASLKGLVCRAAACCVSHIVQEKRQLQIAH